MDGLLARGIRALDHARHVSRTIPAQEVRLALTDLDGAAVKLIRIRQIIEAAR